MQDLQKKLETQLAFNVKLLCPCTVKLQEAVAADIENHILPSLSPLSPF
jgi:hypothetical protein